MSELKVSLNPLVTVIVMNHNRQDLLRACLDSVLKNTAVPYELWVVDWRSTDGSRDMLKDVYGSSITRLVYEDEDLGYAACNTKYMKEVKTPYIMLLNNDCVVFPGYLKNAIECFEADPKVGHVAHLVLRENFLVMSHGANVDMNSNTNIPLMDRAFNDPILATPGNYAYAGFGLFKTEVARNLNWLEAATPETPIYWDDTDYGMKVNAVGLDVRYCPGAIIMHRMVIDANRKHHNNSLNAGRLWFNSRWGKFLHENGGYAPTFPKGSYPVPYRNQ